MSKKIIYNGIELQQMTKEELEKQVDRNKKRIFTNNLFLGVVSIIGLITFPPSAIATSSIGVVRTYWLSKNNKKIQDELRKR